MDYFCEERLALPKPVIRKIPDDLRGMVPLWRELISRSYLSPVRKEGYLTILEERLQRLFPDAV